MAIHSDRTDNLCDDINSRGPGEASGPSGGGCSFGSVPSESLARLSLTPEPRVCCCEWLGETEFVHGWEPKSRKCQFRAAEKEPKKPVLSSQSTSAATAHWSNVRNHIPNLKPWTNGRNKAEQDSAAKDYVFKHYSNCEDYMSDYRSKCVVGSAVSERHVSLGKSDCPDPYMYKFKHSRELLDRLKLLSQQDQQRKPTRVLTPTVIRNKMATDTRACADIRGVGSPIEGVQSVSLGLGSRRLSPGSRTLTQAYSNSDTVQMIRLARGRHQTVTKSPASSESESSEEIREQLTDLSINFADNPNDIPDSAWTPVGGRSSSDSCRNQSVQSRTLSLQEKTLPVAEIHFGAAPAKGKTWTSGSGQYMNLSFPKTTFPVPVRVALTPGGHYSVDNGGLFGHTPRTRSRIRVNLTPSGRKGAQNANGDKLSTRYKAVNGWKNVDKHRRLHSDSATSNGNFHASIHSRTSKSLGAL